MALEALYYSKDLAKDKPIAGAKDLNWAAAIHFIQRIAMGGSIMAGPV